MTQDMGETMALLVACDVLTRRMMMAAGSTPLQVDKCVASPDTGGEMDTERATITTVGGTPEHGTSTHGAKMWQAHREGIAGVRATRTHRAQQGEGRDLHTVEVWRLEQRVRATRWTAIMRRAARQAGVEVRAELAYNAGELRAMLAVIGQAWDACGDDLTRHPSWPCSLQQSVAIWENARAIAQKNRRQSDNSTPPHRGRTESRRPEDADSYRGRAGAPSRHHRGAGGR